ncbi:MAG: hypothetical protein RLZZ15_924 [Verrucomicrobiota bacterium]
METPDLFSLFVRPLHGAGLRYMVSGSLASIFYGEPRLTLDVDLVVHLEPGDAGVLAGLFPAENYYVPPPDVFAVEIARPTRGHFNVIHFASGQKADFYPSRRHAYWAWAFAHRRLGRIGEDEVWFAPPEYVILWKLEFFREGGGDKHLRDIRGMLAVNPDAIDGAMIGRACGELGLAGQWERALRS